ncbi:EFR1 family ferrodoxin [Terrisporobacter petrolearius]|uniref:EFR1 family ferrodoxin n=1 Tax=Terrisporobacter petrolearius TaxID=1460447 RepID=UPI0022DFCEC2|nr:EFR1 family ferrodoxin [Terrisporobacter petrolearius]
MNITMIYFSGTGNSKYIVDYLGNKLKENNHNVKIYNIEQNPIVPIDTDLLVIGGPIYAGNVPEKLIRWVLRNVPESSANSIVYSTSAGLINANGVDSLAKKLSKKGYNILAKETYLMPRNFYFGKYPKNTKDEVDKMLEDVNKQLDELVDKICLDTLSSKEFENKGVLGKDLLAETFSVMSRFMGKSFSVDDNCIKCGICVKNCPENNINFGKDKNIRFSNKCMLCCRCIHNCPKNAINYKGKKYEQYSLL